MVHSSKRFAFSLIELMVVIAIVALLAAIAVPSYKRYAFVASVSPMYTALEKLADLSIERREITSSFGTGIVQDPLSLGTLGSVSLWEGDSYNGGWFGFATSVYGSSTCNGKMGMMDVTIYGTKFGNAEQDNTSHITFWFANKNGVVKKFCTVTIYTVDQSLRTVEIPGCENTRGNVWDNTYTPITNAGMAASTC